MLTLLNSKKEKESSVDKSRSFYIFLPDQWVKMERRPMKIDVAKLQPMTGYVLVEPAEKETVTSSGIVLPTDSAAEKPQYGKVLAIGEAGKDDPKLNFKKGDIVVYKKWGGNDVKIDDISYQFLKFEDILAKVA